MNADGNGIETLGTGFLYPEGIAIQSDGKIVVADAGNNAIKRIAEVSNRVAVNVAVTPDNTAGAGSSTPTLCINTALTAITHATTGATGIGTATGLPAGVTSAWASNTITISGTPTESGTFNYSIPLTGGCGTVNATGTITVERESFTLPADGASTIACLANSTAPTLSTVTSHCGETLIPAAPVITDSPSSLTCEGTRTYAYTYTDSEGNTATWSYVYTIEREPFTISTPNGSATVACLANATAPTLPTVTSNCGETLTPAAAVITDSPSSLTCEGTRTYAYAYTDCEGNTATWSYVYTIDYSGGLTAPSNTTATVSCPAAATDPGVPANITDACGRTVSAV